MDKINMAELLDFVERIKSAPGLRLWGAVGVDKLIETIGGELVEIEPPMGCTSETCSHWSHDPAAPVYKWILPPGYNLQYLGCEDRPPGDLCYYVIFPESESENSENHEVYFVGIHSERGFYDRTCLLKLEDLPIWVLEEYLKLKQ
ncbi:MAG: hypothetical protein QW570_07780 [Candidatus Caldarchaeum sp.]